MASIQHKRRESILFQEVATIVSKKIENANIQVATVTGVKLSGDQSVLKVYVSFVSNSERSFHNLKNANRFVRSQLAKVLNLRKVPKIVFELDKTLVNANRIETIIKKIKKNQKSQV